MREKLVLIVQVAMVSAALGYFTGAAVSLWIIAGVRVCVL